MPYLTSDFGLNPRANEAPATRNGFERGRNTGIPCTGGTCFHAVPNAQFEGGKGMGATARWTLRGKTFRNRDPTPAVVLSPGANSEAFRPGMTAIDDLFNFSSHQHPRPSRFSPCAELGLDRPDRQPTGTARGVAAINARASWPASWPL